MIEHTIQPVDGEQHALCLSALHMWTFGDAAPMPKFEKGDWWLACTPHGDPIAFAGLIRATLEKSAGYFYRVGVLPLHRGHGLQRRLYAACEDRARNRGWKLMVSDTTDNIPSANNMIASGFKLYKPKRPWSFDNALYWRKAL